MGKNPKMASAINDRDLGKYYAARLHYSQTAMGIRRNIGTKGNHSNNISESFNQKNNIQTLKLAFLIMTYVYTADDLKLSRGEVKDIKKAIKENAPHFTSDDLIEVYNFFSDKPDRKYVLGYIVEYGITESMFDTAIDVVLENYKNNKKYSSIIKELKHYYKIECY